MTVDFREGAVTADQIAETVTRAGYEAFPVGKNQPKKSVASKEAPGVSMRVEMKKMRTV